VTLATLEGGGDKEVSPLSDVKEVRPREDVSLGLRECLHELMWLSSDR